LITTMMMIRWTENNNTCVYFFMCYCFLSFLEFVSFNYDGDHRQGRGDCRCKGWVRIGWTALRQLVTMWTWRACASWLHRTWAGRALSCAVCLWYTIWLLLHVVDSNRGVKSRVCMYAKVALLANCGLFVPCSEATVPRFDNFFLRTAGTA
jgi:hypothetical protein